MDQALAGGLVEQHERWGRRRMLGRTAAGRYIAIIIRPAAGSVAVLITARDMTQSERRLYRQEAMTQRTLPPAIESEIPEDDDAAAEYYDTHDISGLMTDAEWVDPVEPVGVQEIAQRAQVQQVTVRKWRERHVGFPVPRWSVSGQPAWSWPDVERWLRRPRRPGRPSARKAG